MSAEWDARVEFVRGAALRRARRRAAYKAELRGRIKAIPKSRVWGYKPQWYWHGWSTLLPTYRSHDEYSRETLVVGWTVTGRIIIALWYCGDLECYEQTLRWHEDVER